MEHYRFFTNSHTYSPSKSGGENAPHAPPCAPALLRRTTCTLIVIVLIDRNIIQHQECVTVRAIKLNLLKSCTSQQTTCKCTCVAMTWRWDRYFTTSSWSRRNTLVLWKTPIQNSRESRHCREMQHTMRMVRWSHGEKYGGKSGIMKYDTVIPPKIRQVQFSANNF